MKKLIFRPSKRIHNALKKLTTSLLAFLIIFLPTASSFAYAQTTTAANPMESTQTSSSSGSENTGPTPSEIFSQSSGGSLTTETPTGDTSSGNPESNPPTSPTGPKPPPPSGSGSIQPVISADNNSYAVSQEFQPQPNSVDGSFNYPYPITVPAGRNQMTPNVSLEYNNQTGEDVSQYG